jgi:hypothetical protein
VVVDVVATPLVISKVVDISSSFASDGINTSLDVGVVEKDKTSTASARGELVAQRDGVEGPSDRARGSAGTSAVVRSNDFTKGVATYVTIRRQRHNLLSEVITNSSGFMGDSSILAMRVVIIGFASIDEVPFNAVIVLTRSDRVVLASVVGAITVPSRTIPAPVKRRRKASARLARAVLFD